MKFLVEQVERVTGLRNFGIYMNQLFTIDALFLNEDRHTHNMAVLMDGEGRFSLRPVHYIVRIIFYLNQVLCFVYID